MTTCTRTRRPRLATRLPQLEFDTELTRIELGYRAAMAMEIEHIRPDLVRERAIVAVRIARARQASGWAELAAVYGRQPLVYLRTSTGCTSRTRARRCGIAPGTTPGGPPTWKPGSRGTRPGTAPASWPSCTRRTSPGNSPGSGPGHGTANGS